MKDETEVTIKFTVPDKVKYNYESIIQEFINKIWEIDIDIDVVEDYKGYPSIDVPEYFDRP